MAANPSVSTTSSCDPSGQPSALNVSPAEGPATLRRHGSRSSQRSGLVPSPRVPYSILPSTTASSSASGSKSGSFISTPKILSRRNSARDSHSFLGRKISLKGKGREDVEFPDDSRSPMSESGSAEVIETPHVRMERDPGTGRKMINQYLVLQEIGHGTHGRVRLGQDMSTELPSGDDGDVGLGIVGGVYYAIKIVDRNPKRKRLTGFSKQKGVLGRNDGGKMVNENEIRKEIAIFKKVNHPNVVRMKEIIDDPESSKLFMILEYCDKGEIRWKEGDGLPALTLAEIRSIFRDTLLGLEYLHHQGIIHRDIKPSNLLLAKDGTVKISDFGCSHYSEALRVAAAQPGPEGDQYVDDIELAKTAGSPAFFAPEMCFPGFEADSDLQRSVSPRGPVGVDLPAFTLRPPSVAEDHNETRASYSDPLVASTGERTFPLKPTSSNDSFIPARFSNTRSISSSILPPRKQRLPITNAIDVWALGVTLYCLLFGRTPFDAPNEYLLMQVIPTAHYEVPPSMGSDHIATSTPEALECLDLLSKLLEKEPTKRITLEQAKKHQFTLRDLSDPTGWLASTDPHAQSFVTVSNDEVAAVVVKSSSFRDRFRKGIKTISHKLQIFSAVGRSRSRSIGDSESGLNSAHTSNAPSTVASEINLQRTPPIKRASNRAASTTREASPVTSPPFPGTLTRRFSLLGSKPTDSPRIQTANLPGPGFVVHRESSHKPYAVIPLAEPSSPRQLASSSSLDKLKGPLESSPTSSLRRRQSSDIDILGRQRSPSNASSNTSLNIGSKLVRLLSRNGSQRSRLLRRDQAVSTDAEDAGLSAGGSPTPGPLRSLGEDMPRPSSDTVESSSYSSSYGPDGPRSAWESRLRRELPLRRGSNLSEELPHPVDEEEVDWNEPLSDDDDYDEAGPSLQFSAPHFKPSWHQMPEVSPSKELDGYTAHVPVSAQPQLDSISDTSDSQNNTAKNPPDFRPRSSSRNSPYRANFLDRARSPLGHSSEDRSHAIIDDGQDDDDGLAISIGSRRGRKGSMRIVSDL